MPTVEPDTSTQGHISVWRPKDFAGQIELNRFVNVHDLQVPPFMSTAYLIMAVTGSGSVRRGRSVVRYSKLENAVMIQQPGEVFGFDALENTSTTVFALALGPSVVTDFAAELGMNNAVRFSHTLVPAALSAPLATLLVEMFGVFGRRAPPLERETYLMRLLRLALERYTDAPPAAMRLGQEAQAVALVKEALHADTEYRHTLDDLARVAQLNKVYLHEVFKRDVGLSPFEYQMSLRLLEARARLAEGEPIAHVAFTTGFADQSHFTRTFKRHTGTTPGRFRRDSMKTHADAV